MAQQSENIGSNDWKKETKSEQLIKAQASLTELQTCGGLTKHQNMRSIVNNCKITPHQLYTILIATLFTICSYFDMTIQD